MNIQKITYSIVCLLACALSSFSLNAQGTKLLRQPSISEDKISFVYGGVIWIVNMKKYHSNASDRVQKNIDTAIDDIREGEIKKRYCIANGIKSKDTVSIPYFSNIILQRSSGIRT
jgi:hypothetical protein